MKFIHKQTVIDAVQFNGDNHAAILNIAKSKLVDSEVIGEQFKITLSNREFRINPTDWVILGVTGEVYECNDRAFRESYDPIVSDKVYGERANREL